MKFVDVNETFNNASYMNLYQGDPRVADLSSKLQMALYQLGMQANFINEVEKERYMMFADSIPTVNGITEVSEKVKITRQQFQDQNFVQTEENKMTL